MMVPPDVMIGVLVLVGLVGVVSGAIWLRQYLRFLAKLHYDKGVVSLQTADYTRAEEEFRAALKRQSRMIEARYGLGCTYVQQQRYREGIATLKEVVKAMPHNGVAYYNLGMAYIAVGNLDEAQEALQTALQLKPAMKEIHFNLSNVCLEKGDVKQASMHCENALKLDRDYSKAQELQKQLAEIRYVAPINLNLIRKALHDFDQDDTEFLIKL